ncbi:FkbM family methyltransferase [Nodularia spumigena CS-584]|uniref:FkbM family methyltransferase n=1 Tax=Nodularia spumigena TaxID=70799 RepID=UPI0000EAA3BF|nr:FkbM family methyltransferase [Nodularia spumigena]AHJ28187.1 HlpA protein [Nodularia spumigena CCY9414]EAW46070.1 Glycosyl transferase, group 1 [Nodularia spumigena CCY9414]MDB9383555.1 FkbM family methyltransferase [Nodularia spumigena CS-584]
MSTWQLSIPVALIFFHRTDTTQRIFEAIREAQPPTLLVICDAPRTDKEGEAEKCAATRAIINQVDWECEVLTNYSDVNLGPRKRISSGIDWVFEQVEEAIILEHDCLPHPTFFRYCEELLEKYRDNENIMIISGNNLQFGRKRTEDSYYFSRYSHIWGWATWRRAWNKYDVSIEIWDSLKESSWLHNFLQNEQATMYWSRRFDHVLNGFNTWDYSLLFSLWINEGLCILPEVNLVSNIGFGANAENCKDTSSPLANMKAEPIKFPLKHPPTVTRNIEADDFTEQYIFSGGSKNSKLTFISYAQNFEDVLLNRVFKYKTRGFYIDVGALHPTFDSVTKAFYDRGWSGINIEPIKEYHNLFQQQRPRDINLNIALSNLEGKLDFFQVVGQPGNSTLNKEIAYEIAKEKDLDVSQYTVSVKTLASICKEYVNQKIDFLKIDVEGLEEDVILSGNWEIFRPTVLVIETTQPNTNIRCKNNIPQILTDKGYKHVFFDGINDYYIAAESENLAKHFAYPVNILDFYVNYRFVEQQRQINELNRILNSKNNSIPTIQTTNLQSVQSENINFLKPTILIDGVFFQLYNTGIARVWRSLLEQWANTDFAQHILVLDRANTAPKIPGIRYRTIHPYDYNNSEADKQILQQICEEEQAKLFISTYYTTPIDTPSVFMAYDMIPEVLGGNLNEPMWREKHNAIKHASAYISISEHTAKDLSKLFSDIPLESINVAHCGVADHFSPASQNEINTFKHKYGISKPYFLLGGLRGYKNSILFFQAFSQLANKQGFDIVATGAGSQLPPEWRQYTAGCTFHSLQLTDEELRLAYSGAVALVYPSKYEGFGMPIIEAMACACPVITCPNASIPEVGGEAVIYVNDDDVIALADALCEVQKPSLRNVLINAGLAQAKKFSWTNMAEIVSTALVDATLLYLNLRDINYIIFPDWTQPEDELGLELQQVIQTLATHPESEKITLIINVGNIATEDAEMFLSSVAMNLLMMEDLDISDSINISLIPELANMQWQCLLPRIHSKIILNHEDATAFKSAPVSNLNNLPIDNLIPS